LDEPTAVLTPQEVTHLFERLKNLQEMGKTIIVITHKLKEILHFTERVTVMRHGKVVTTQATHELTEQSLSQLIMGRERTSFSKITPELKSSIVFEARGVCTNTKRHLNLRNVTFQVNAGEIVGLAGIEGSGQDLLVETICQLKPFSGDLFLKEDSLKSKTLYDHRQAGFGLIPLDRHQEGFILGFSNADNLILGHHREPSFQRHWVLQADGISQFAQRRLSDFNIFPADPRLSTGSLSGGNQQKLLFARETEYKLDFFLVCHPTRGVDIGASDFIHSQLLELANRGAGILLVSSDLDELFSLSHRILVMREGTLVANSPTSELSVSNLGLAMIGAQP
jgi:simple sugar transport system ATP-binding protein